MSTVSSRTKAPTSPRRLGQNSSAESKAPVYSVAPSSRITSPGRPLAVKKVEIPTLVVPTRISKPITLPSHTAPTERPLLFKLEGGRITKVELVDGQTIKLTVM